jgi:hypothetical protein
MGESETMHQDTLPDYDAAKLEAIRKAPLVIGMSQGMLKATLAS